MTIPIPSTRPGGAAQRRVLVVCTGNSARSIMAEALFQTLGAGAIEVVSAGSAPTGQVHPMALEQIGRLPVDPSRYASKSLASVLAAATTPFDLVVTVCDHAAESCGTFPGDPARVHWGLADPAAHQEPQQTRQAFSACFDELAERIGALLSEPVA